MENNLQTKLTRVDEAISTLKNHLHLPNNAPIEDVAHLENLLNVFVQPNEPDKKEGIWIQAEGDFNKDILITDTPYVKERIFQSWTAETMQNTPFSSSTYGAVAMVGECIYVFGSSTTNYNYTAYKYNLRTKTTTILSTPTPEKFIYYSWTCVKGTDIYIFGSHNNSKATYKYDTLTDTYTRLADMPLASYKGRALVVGDYIYVLRGSSESANYRCTRDMYCYDIINDRYESGMTGPVFCDDYCIMASLGDKLYFIGGAATRNGMDLNDTSDNVTKVYVYDTTTGLSTVVATYDGTYKDLISQYVVVKDADIYFISAYTDGMVKFSTQYNTFERVSQGGKGYINKRSGGSWIWNNKFVSYSGTSISMIDFSETSDYTGEVDTVLIYQRPGSNTYTSHFLDLYKIANRFLTSFTDAGYYSVENGVINNYPTYYGNGSQWIKFKG